MAMDPFMKTENRYCMDSGAYVIKNTAAPACRNFSMGNNKRIPLAIVSINLLSIVLRHICVRSVLHTNTK